MIKQVSNSDILPLDWLRIDATKANVPFYLTLSWSGRDVFIHFQRVAVQNAAVPGGIWTRTYDYIFFGDNNFATNTPIVFL